VKNDPPKIDTKHPKTGSLQPDFASLDPKNRYANPHFCISAEEFNNARNWFYELENRDADDTIYYPSSTSHCILSAPHAVRHLRDGKTKLAEPTSISYVSILSKLTNSSSLYATRASSVDAYQSKLRNCIANGRFKLLLDMHSMAPTHTELANVGIAHGALLNTEAKRKSFNIFMDLFAKNGIDVSIDHPFAATQPQTNAFQFGRDPNLLALQLEMNSKLSHPEYNTELNSCLKSLTQFIDYTQSKEF